MTKQKKGFTVWYEEKVKSPEFLEAYRAYKEAARSAGERASPRMIWASEVYHGLIKETS